MEFKKLLCYRYAWREVKSLLNICMFLVSPLFVWIVHIYLVRHGNMGIRRKFVILLIYLICINMCVFSISYARGIKSFNFGQMSLSYRLKYMGLGSILGLIFLMAIKIGHNRVKQSDTCLPNKETRYSNFDLLKIIAIGMIILFHYAYGKWDYSSMGNYKVIMDVIWMFGELGVNVFALISGYFMIGQERPFKPKKICLMWVQVLFYSILSTMIAFKIGRWEIDQDKVLQTIFPISYKIWWYASAYFGLYFLAPFLNKGLRSLEKRGLEGFSFFFYQRFL